MPGPESESPAADRSWDDAACGLLELDERRVIVRANVRFLARTGYTPADLARGLRWIDVLAPASRLFFETQLSTMLTLNGSLEEVLLELVCPDGRRIPALINADVIDGAAGVRIAVMSVPDRKEYESRLRDARRRAEHSEQAGELTRRRLELIAGANAALLSSLEVETALTRLARVLVDGIADWCLVYAVDPDQETDQPRWSAVHADASRQHYLDELAVLLPRHASPTSGLRRALSGAAPQLLAEVTPEHLSATTTSAEVLELYRTLGPTSAVVVPSYARARLAAVFILIRSAPRPAFTADDLADITDLAARTGTAIDNLRLYAREHSTSVALQKALLTPTPAIANLEIATRYVPGANGSEIGGDWYDAFRQVDGSTVLVIGDVVGHDIEAAAAMGQLRGVVRTIAHTEAGTAAQTLAQADRAAAGLQLDAVASAIVVRVPGPHQSSGEDVAVEWAIAGHPPPIVVRRDGAAEVLTRRPDPLLGVAPGRERHDHHITLQAGDTLLLYTDGLVERRDEDIDESIAGLARRLTTPGRAPTPDELCERALNGRPADSTDDVALLAIRFRPAPARPPR
jgi:hypothetical protein